MPLVAELPVNPHRAAAEAVGTAEAVGPAEAVDGLAICAALKRAATLPAVARK